MPSRLCYFFNNTTRALNIKYFRSIVLLKIAISKLIWIELKKYRGLTQAQVAENGISY